MAVAAVVSAAVAAADQISDLAESFPSLRGRYGVRPWRPLEFARAGLRGKSTAELQAGLFVLSVWSAGRIPWFSGEPYRLGVFDAVAAFAVWDQEHRDAFLRWCDDPFWP